MTCFGGNLLGELKQPPMRFLCLRLGKSATAQNAPQPKIRTNLLEAFGEQSSCYLVKWVPLFFLLVSIGSVSDQTRTLPSSWYGLLGYLFSCSKLPVAVFKTALVLEASRAEITANFAEDFTSAAFLCPLENHWGAQRLIRRRFHAGLGGRVPHIPPFWWFRSITLGGHDVCRSSKSRFHGHAFQRKARKPERFPQKSPAALKPNRTPQRKRQAAHRGAAILARGCRADDRRPATATNKHGSAQTAILKGMSFCKRFLCTSMCVAGTVNQAGPVRHSNWLQFGLKSLRTDPDTYSYRYPPPLGIPKDRKCRETTSKLRKGVWLKN